MTGDLARILLAGAAGVLLALAWLRLLWGTVRRLPRQEHPAVWAAGGFLARLALVAAGFVLAGGGDWRRFAACLAGFVLARAAVLRRMRAGSGGVKGVFTTKTQSTQRQDETTSAET